MRRPSFPLYALLIACACKGDSRELGSDGRATSQAADWGDQGEAQSSAEGSGVGDDSGARLDVSVACGGPDPGDARPECEPGSIPPANAVLTGRVLSPNLDIPISGAAVYLTTDPVDPVPDGVYCAECVKLPCRERLAVTEADGSFELHAVAGPGQQLVVQKGQFLRVVDYEVTEGCTTVAPEDSSLPREWNPEQGLWIPRIAVYEADPDAVFNVLAKFGLGEVDNSGRLVRGTEQFTLLREGEGDFLDRLDNLNDFHIIFVPCHAPDRWLMSPEVPPERAQNIRDYVEAGGSWYVTDHANEYISAPFPAYQDFHSPQMPDLQPGFDVVGTVVDPDLEAWLEALPPELKDIGGGSPTLANLPQVEFLKNYSGIDAIHEILVEDAEGNEVNVGHHTWVEGPCSSCADPEVPRPMAVTGGWGCGKMMFSTFESTSGRSPHTGLNPQELALLYMILEIGVCHATMPPPPPPAG